MSIKPVPTLKGMFNEQKAIHRRDFLRDNKLNLRELQRVTKTKQSEAQQQQLKEKPWRPFEQLPQHAPPKAPEPKGAAIAAAKRRSASLQRSNGPSGAGSMRSVSNQQKQKQQQHDQDSPVSTGRCASCLERMDRESLSQRQSCTKEIQTDDIYDEDFLYKSLKKCSSYDLKSAADNHTVHDDRFDGGGDQMYAQHDDDFVDDLGDDYDYEPQEPQPMNGLSDLPSGGRGRSGYPAHLNQQMDDNISINSKMTIQSGNGLQDDPRQLHASHSRTSLQDRNMMNDDASSINVPIQMSSNNNNNNDEGFETIFENMSMKDNQSQQQMTGRSRQTNITQRSGQQLLKKKSTPSIQRSTGGGDVRLPRYLEREKRAKEQKKILEKPIDPDCPPGHRALTEEARVAGLATIDRKFKEFVHELNHQPLTSQTLRTRTRRNQIEKELQALEEEKRVLTKTKVYVKIDE